MQEQARVLLAMAVQRTECSCIVVTSSLEIKEIDITSVSNHVYQFFSLIGSNHHQFKVGSTTLL